MRRYSSGQRGHAVNVLALPTQVRILPGAPKAKREKQAFGLLFSFNTVLYMNGQIGRVLFLGENTLSYKFTPQAYRNLLASIKDLEKRKNKVRAGMADHSIAQRGIDREEDGRILCAEPFTEQLQSLQERLDDLLEQKAQAMVIQDDLTDISTLGIGRIATIQRYRDAEGSEPIGASDRYRVGSYRETDLKQDPPLIGYDSPILAGFIGEKVDSNRELEILRIERTTQYLELMKIEVPSQLAAKQVA